MNVNKFLASLVGILLLNATPVVSQSCPPAGTSIPSCLAGSWIGTNSAMQRIKEVLQSMPSSNSSRTVNADDFATVLGMHISEDGFYSTIPIHRSVVIDDVTDDKLVTTDMNLVITTAVGNLWTSGNQMYFCVMPGSGQPTLRVGVTSNGVSGSAIVSPFGPPGFTPEIDYNCSGDQFNFTVHLPAPIGNVDYYFNRVPLSRFDEEYRDTIDSRFAPADGDDG